MSEEGKIEKIGKISKSVKSPEEALQKPQGLPPDQDHFASLVKQGKGAEEIKVAEQGAEEVNTQTTLMDEVRNANQGGKVYGDLSPEGLVAQAQDVINKIDNLKRDLNTPNLELKGSVQNMLKNKLEHIDENLKVALSKVGTEYTPATEEANLSGLGKPIERFIGFLTHSQYQLENLASDVNMMHLNAENINPAHMLAMQIKVNYVQQELEFFTSLLNKALESTKTVMNVQV